MTLGRSLPPLALVLLLVGCALTQNTVAQDLAWERWNKCNHFRTVRLKEIKTDGTIWVWTEYGSDWTDWQACDAQARREQAQGARGSIPQSVAAVASTSQSADALSTVPVWKPGYEWAYRYESPAGNGTYVWSVDREEAIDGIPHYVIKTGSREIFYRKSDFAYTMETVDGTVVYRSTPPRLLVKWPLQVGQTWDQTTLEERPAARQTLERTDTVTVEAEETVEVPAGAFKTLKIVCRNKKTGAIRYESWYSPELKQTVKLRENLETGTRIRELITFKLR